MVVEDCCRCLKCDMVEVDMSTKNIKINLKVF